MLPSADSRYGTQVVDLDVSLQAFYDGLPLEDSPDRLDQSGPIFIMGCPRSGTTVLADVIAMLPDALVKVGVLVPDRVMHLFGSGQLSPESEEHLLWTQRYILWRAFIEMHGSRM